MIEAWGYDDNGQVSNTPTGNDFVYVSAGGYQNLALKSDGSLIGWGSNDYGQISNIPVGINFVSVSSGLGHNVALKSDGSLVAWGYDYYGQVSNTPIGNDFVVISAGEYTNVALKSDGSLVVWGKDEFGEVSNAPSSNDFIDVSAGEWSIVALKSDGSLLTWGRDYRGQVSDTPTGNNFIDITVGSWHSVALTPAADVFEDFSSEPVPFSNEPYFSISDGRLFFNGDGSDGVSGVIWVGESNPGGEFPLRKNSNYFENFSVSVDTYWEGGADNYAYGLSVCTQKNMSGTEEYVYFSINKKGAYLIGKKQEDDYEIIADWISSSLIVKNDSKNILSIKKVGPYFHFYINEVEVAKRIIEGFPGGGVGVGASQQVDASFDNFTVTKLSVDDIEDDSNNVFENFSNGSGGFHESAQWSVPDGRFHFFGDRSKTGWRATNWQGGFSPGGQFPQSNNSNFFENFHVAVDTFWEGGQNNFSYGLMVCIQENIDGTIDYIYFQIVDLGAYRIYRRLEGVYETIVDWTESSLIASNGQKNNLAINKAGNEFRFFINNTEIERLTIDGFPGGGIGVSATHQVDVGFDNFSVTKPGTPPTANAGVDQTVNEGKPVTLNGTDSFDPDDGIYSYQWYQIAGPPVTLSKPTIVQPTFTAPDGASLTFQLTVTDYSGLHSTDICVVTIRIRKAMPWIPLLLLDD